jgi:hypothetical protein
MDYTTLFYWLVVADNAKTMFVTFVVIFTIISIGSTIGFIVTAGNDEDQTLARKWLWWSLPFCVFFWFLYVFTPSKKDALLIVAGGQTLNFLTTDESTKQIPKELSGFILSELKNMAADAQVELGIKGQKERIIEEAKSMTTEELLNRMNQDSLFTKIILDK